MVRNFGGQDSIPLKLLENIQRNTFQWFDARYNSKLFGAHLADEMAVHNTPLANIVSEMCQVSFASMNADILGATYEQYLGQTLEIDRHSDSPRLVANLETRQQQGSYYTPTRIVHEIVDQTLGAYLYGPTSELRGPAPLKAVRKTLFEIRNLRVLDPACGSGSFLIYAFDVLHAFYSAEKARLERGLQNRISELVAAGIPPLAAGAEPDPELIGIRAELELARFAPAQIIERHLYGVDLDPQAAEVASMNLLLKALHRDQRLPKILGDNVKVGNSLVSGVQVSEVLQKQQRDELITIRNEVHKLTFLASENTTDRAEYERKIDALETKFRETADTINSQLNAALQDNGENGWFQNVSAQNPFNWQVEFPECFSDESVRGFTFVIGNPPYVGFHGFKDQKTFLRDVYFSASGKFDLYVPFVERGLQLTKPDGVLSFICPSTFMKRGFGRKLREHILQYSVEGIHDFLHLQVFRKVLNYTVILAIRRHTPAHDHKLRYSEGELGSPLKAFAQNELSAEPWVFRFGSDATLVSRIQSEDHYIEIGNEQITSGVAEGIVTGKNSVLLIHASVIQRNGLETKYLPKCVRGEDIKRYSVNWGGFHVFYPYELRAGKTCAIDEEVLKEACPIMYSYLRERQGDLESRTYFQGTTKKWFELWCPRDIRDHNSEKIVVPELADRSQFAFVNGEYMYVDTTCGFSAKPGVSPWYVLGVLNSRPGEMLYRKTSVPKANGFLIYKTMFLNPFRIPAPDQIDRAQYEEIADTAESIQALQRRASSIASRFADCLSAALPVMNAPGQNFYRDYYGVSQYWADRRFTVANALDLEEEVVRINVDIDSDGGPLAISYCSVDGKWKRLLECRAYDPDLQLFVFLALRGFLRNNERRKSWKLAGRRASKRTVDVILQNLIVPKWGLGLGSAITDPVDLSLSRIREVMNDVRRALGEAPLNLSTLEREAEQKSRHIDTLVSELYQMDCVDEIPEASRLPYGTPD
jgi:adenine-specific DNA-methyltransferase